jgi:hypothetical protein
MSNRKTSFASAAGAAAGLMAVVALAGADRRLVSGLLSAGHGLARTAGSHPRPGGRTACGCERSAMPSAVTSVRVIRLPAMSQLGQTAAAEAAARRHRAGSGEGARPGPTPLQPTEVAARGAQLPGSAGRRIPAGVHGRRPQPSPGHRCGHWMRGCHGHRTRRRQMGSAVIVVLGDAVQADRHRGPGALPVTPATTSRLAEAA